MMYIKPFPPGMSVSMTLDALSRLNLIEADYEISVTNEIMVSIKDLFKESSLPMLVPNVYYDLYNKYGLQMTDCTVCLTYDRRYLKFYTHGYRYLEIDYQTGTPFVFPDYRSESLLHSIGLDCFGDSNYLIQS